MKKRSRIISLLLAALMMFGVPAQAIYAAESTTMQETVNAEDENEALEVVQNSENTENTEEVQSTEDVQGTQPVMESESAGEETQNLLNYLVVDKPYIEQGDIQSIVASVGDENTVVESATLAYHRESDGKTYQADVSEYKDHVMLFKISFEESAETGVYILDSLTYTVDGEVHTVELAKIGIEAKYGVNTEVESTADAEVVDSETEDSTTADIDVVTFDAEGNQTSANSIEEAITEQKEELNSGKARISTRSRAGNVVVVLDPGHDSTHAGAQGLNGLHEETLNFKIAQYCKEELQQYSGVTVYMTRNSVACPYPGTSSGEDNAKRVAYAQSVGANVYVSIHLNSAGASANGAMVFYPNQNYRSDIGSQGQNLASQVLTQLKALGLKDNGVKIRNSESGDTYSDGSLADYYGVIRGSKKAGFPGIIIEHAFVTNASDAAFLSSEANLKKLGQADATGIANYFGLVKGEWVQDKNGWWFRYSNGTWPANERVFIGGYWYYFNNNGYRETGWLNLNGVKYYLNENGQMITGWKQFDNTWYYFNQSGVMQTGWVAVGGTWYYLESDGKMATGWKNLNEKWYYLSASGAMYTGVQSVDGKTYNFGSSGYVIDSWINKNGAWYYMQSDRNYVTGWKKIGNYTYYFDSDGVMYTGKHEINGKTYDFGTSGGIFTGWYIKDNIWHYTKEDLTQATGFNQINGQTYYFDGTGRMQIGWRFIDNTWYWFNSSGAMYTGWLLLNNKWYYLEPDGKMVTGWKTVGNASYYFNSSGAMCTGNATIDGKLYRFSASGAVIEGWIYQNNIWYWLNVDGTYAKGFKTIGNAVYYFNEKEQMVTGWQNISNTWYWFNESGAMWTGWLLSGNAWYYLDSDGKMVIGWKKIGTYSYYFDPSGKMYTGKKIVDGKTYDFGTSGGILSGWYLKDNTWYYTKEDLAQATGFNQINGQTYYFDGTGRMQTGWKYVDNTWYWFNNSGFMRTGWLLLGNTWYYFESDGKMVTGWKTVNGSRYYFEASGAMVTGYHVIDGKSYDFGTDGRCQTVLQDGWNSESDTWYYVSGGQLVKGWKQIGSTWYYMDKDTGKMQTGWVKVGDYWYWFSGSGAMLTGYQQINGTWYYMNKKGNDKGPEGALTYTGVTSIMGTSMLGTDKATVVQKMVNQYVKSNAIYPSEALAVGGAPDIVTFCGILYDEAVAENIKPEIMYAQAMLETGYLKYGGIVQVWQFNFGGLGAVDGNASGGCATFPDVRTGLRAQVQHLKAYASKETLNNSCVDPRFNMVTRGTAPYVEWLGQKENPNVNSKGDSYGWASGESYGFNIMSMINRMN